MKKNFLRLTLFALLIVSFLPLSAQDMQIKVKADTILVPGGSCNIELNVTGGVAPYTYMLFDKEPWEGGRQLEKVASVYETSHTFTVQNAGSYIIAISDGKELTKFFTITIKAAGTSFIAPKSAVLLKRYLI